MNIKHSFLFILTFLLLSTTACKTKKGIATSTEGKLTAESVQKRLIKNQLNAEWLVGRAKVSINGGGFAQSGTAELRMRKDSVIWMSVRKFGFEGARALITKDSVFLLDKLNRRYAAEDLSFLSKEYNLPANFSTLQAMLLGNPIFLGMGEMQLEEGDAQLRLSNESNGRKSNYVVQTEEYRLEQMIFEDTAEKQTLTNTYEGYSTLADGQNFSYIRTIDVDSPSTGELGLRLEFTKIDINIPTSIRFEIPPQYTRMK